jgi:hypothetical protein
VRANTLGLVLIQVSGMSQNTGCSRTQVLAGSIQFFTTAEQNDPSVFHDIHFPSVSWLEFCLILVL